MERKWWTLIAVLIGMFMLLLDITIVNVALPEMQKDFHASLSDLQWVIDAYALTLAAGLLTTGAFADIWGRRKLFVIGTVIFTVGSLLCGLATDSLFLSLARAAQGIGGATMFSTSLALLGVTFRGKDRGVAFSFYGAVAGIAVAVGPVMGGVITSGLSWRWIFLVNIPIGIIVGIILLTRVDESRNPHANPPDWLGFVTFTGSLSLLVYGLISSGDGWSANKVVWSLAGAGVLFAAFLVAEFTQEKAMLDLTLFRKPTFVGGLVAAFAISAGLFSLFTFLVLYVQSELGYSAVATGVRFLTLSGAIFVASAIAGRLTTVVPVRLMMGGGFALIGLGLVLMHGVTTTSDWTHLIPGFVVAGIGAGFVNVPLASTAIGVVHPARSGMASGINSSFRQIGIATGIAALGSVFTNKLRDTVQHDLSNSPLSAQAHQIAQGMGGSHAAQPSGEGLPPGAAQIVSDAARSGFMDGLNEILAIGAGISFVAAVLCLVLIRKKDFIPMPTFPQGGPPGGPGPDGAKPATAEIS